MKFGQKKKVFSKEGNFPSIPTGLSLIKIWAGSILLIKKNTSEFFLRSQEMNVYIKVCVSAQEYIRVH